MKVHFSNFKSWLVITLSMCLLGIVTLFSCGKSTPPEPDPANPVVKDEMYFIINGKKVICKLPAKKYQTSVFNGDTSMEWVGNIPIGVGGDTIVSITHGGPRIKGINYTMFDFAAKPEHVVVDIVLGDIFTSPSVRPDGGDYTIEKINGKWVSTLKNGVGYDTRDNSKRYTGIEFRIIWPN